MPCRPAAAATQLLSAPADSVAMYFTHEKLDVYRAALDFVAVAEQTRDSIPRGRGHLADQLQRASSSIVLNVAEGAGKFDPREKRRFYAMAAGSATECAAIFDVLVRLNLSEESDAMSAKVLLGRIAGMLVRLMAAMEGKAGD